MKNIVKYSLILTLCILAMAVSVVSANSFKRTQVGQQVEDFTLEAIDGSPHSLKGSLGQKATVVVFWAAWSPRSAEILTDLQKLYADYGPEALTVIGVNVEHAEWDPTEVDKIAKVAGDSGVTFTMILDKNLEIFNKFGVIAVPSAVLLSPDLKVVQLLTGYATISHDSFKEDVLRALGELKEVDESVSDAPVVYKPKGKAIRYYNMAVKLAKKKRYSRALKSLETAFKADPDYADAHRLLAQIHEKKGENDKAALAHAKADELQNAFNREHGITTVVKTEINTEKGVPKTAAEKLADMMAKKAARAEEPAVKKVEAPAKPVVVQSATKVEVTGQALGVVAPETVKEEEAATSTAPVIGEQAPTKVEVEKKRVRVRPHTN